MIGIGEGACMILYQLFDGQYECGGCWECWYTELPEPITPRDDGDW